MQTTAMLARKSGTKMALFNQLTHCNNLNGRNNFGTPELGAAMAAMLDEQRDNALVFLECNTEELSGLPDGCGIQAVIKCKEIAGLPSNTYFTNILFRYHDFSIVLCSICFYI